MIEFLLGCIWVLLQCSAGLATLIFLIFILCFLVLYIQKFIYFCKERS